jgi:hypothetical protein
MDKQYRTIRAFMNMAVKYLTPQGKIFFKEDHCALCDVHLIKREIWQDGVLAKKEDGTPVYYFNCKGCPLASAKGTCGCIEFKTYRRAQDVYRNKKHIINNEPCAEFIARSKFFVKYLFIISIWPASRFTKKGWKYSGNEISREG